VGGVAAQPERSQGSGDEQQDQQALNQAHICAWIAVAHLQLELAGRGPLSSARPQGVAAWGLARLAAQRSCPTGLMGSCRLPAFNPALDAICTGGSAQKGTPPALDSPTALITNVPAAEEPAAQFKLMRSLWHASSRPPGYASTQANRSGSH
jgi:hypothetical protein